MGIKVQFNGLNNKINVGLKESNASTEIKSAGAVYLKGEDGATFYPEVSEDGVLSWSNNKSLDNPSSVNIKGPAGPQGEAGATGPQGPKGETGSSGVYIGSGEMPVDCNVQIDPNGDTLSLDDLYEIKYCSDCREVTEGGLYYIDGKTLNKPKEIIELASLFVQPVKTNDGTDVYLTIRYKSMIIHCYYSEDKRSKKLEPVWEWENPPMIVWQEYRTTERFNNRPVYTKVFGISTLHGPGTQEAGHGSSYIKNIIRIMGTTSDGNTIPGANSTIYATKQKAYVTTSAKEDLTNILVQIWYTKSTD